MTRTNTSSELRAGALIDNRYEIVSLLGSGGFANVYEARHVHLDRTIALKVLHPPLSATSGPDAPFAKRFEQEARIAAALDHPNVVAIFDYGFLPTEEPFIAMAYLEGHDLEEELVRTGRVEPRRAVNLMKDCLEGVAHGHSKGVVHKDLKPSNLYLVNPGTREERLIVLDFGIARVFTDPDAKLTKSGLFSGTPAYLAPEYIREQTVSPALDVYQMGLILIEMLIGRPAVEADGPMAYLLAHCMGRLTVDPSFFESDLGKVLQRAIAIHPNERYQTAAEFADALAAVNVSATSVTEESIRLPDRSISHAEVEAFAATLPEEVLKDTNEWGAHEGEPHVTPGPAVASSSPSNPTQTREAPRPTVSIHDAAVDERKWLPVAVVALLLVITGAAVAAFLHEDPPAQPEQPTVEAARSEKEIVFMVDDSAVQAVASLASERVGSAFDAGEAAQAKAAAKGEEAEEVEKATKPVTRPRPRPKPKPKPVETKPEKNPALIGD